MKVYNCKTPIFNTSAGVRQGCMLSPELFIFFINELVHEMHASCDHGIFVNQNIEDLMLLLFADDIVLFSFYRKGLTETVRCAK